MQEAIGKKNGQKRSEQPRDGIPGDTDTFLFPDANPIRIENIILINIGIDNNSKNKKIILQTAQAKLKLKQRAKAKAPPKKDSWPRDPSVNDVVGCMYTENVGPWHNMEYVQTEVSTWAAAKAE